MTGGICGPPAPVTDRREVLHLDVHPAEVYAPDVREHPFYARVFVTDGRVVAWTAPTDEHGRYKEPELVVDAPYRGPTPERTRGSFYGQLDLDTDAGPVRITRGGGCGCHSPLRNVDPPATW